MPDRDDLAYKSEIDLLVSACLAAGVRAAVDNPSDLGRMLWLANIECADHRRVFQDDPFGLMEEHRDRARNYVFTLSDTAYYDQVLVEIDDYERLLPEVDDYQSSNARHAVRQARAFFQPKAAKLDRWCQFAMVVAQFGFAALLAGAAFIWINLDGGKTWHNGVGPDMIWLWPVVYFAGSQFVVAGSIAVFYTLRMKPGWPVRIIALCTVVAVVALGLSGNTHLQFAAGETAAFSTLIVAMGPRYQ
jgi:hypothetical protein